MTLIKSAVVFGSGSMGSGIAALLASTGIKVTLLDIPTEGPDRNARAAQAIELQRKRGGFFHEKFAANITAGNSEDHLAACAQADWVIEAIFENLEAKHALYRAIEPHLGPETIISSNTSTLRLSYLKEAVSESVKRRFFITHFFNPPRIMPLVEVVGDGSEHIVEIIERQLGKRALLCRDTPGFVANRIGNFWMAAAAHIALAQGVSIEHADAAFSSLLGIPRTGVFGLFDYIGIQLVPGVWGTFLEQLPPEDAYHKYDIVHHPLFQGLIERGYTGRTGPSGFYRGRNEVLNQDFSYRPKQPVDLPKDPRALLDQDAYTCEVFCEFLRYCCDHLDEIADSVEDIDHGMQWGYSWKQGPFALADTIGVEYLASLYPDGAPEKLQQAVHNGGFYPPREKEAGKVVSIQKHANGVSVLRTHSKLGVLTPEVIAALEKAAQGKHKALVIAHADPTVFSAGAHLPSLAQGDVAFIRRGASVLRALHYAPFPVVVAASGLALGGGAELLLQADAVVAHVDLRIGFPERNVGIFPGWGGPMEHLRRLVAAGVAHPQQQALDTALNTTPLRGAYAALDAHLLRPSDRIEVSAQHLVEAAVELAATLAQDYQAPAVWEVPRSQTPLQAEPQDEADEHVVAALCDLLSGGTPISEDAWLEQSLKAVVELGMQPANQAKLQGFVAARGIR